MLAIFAAEVISPPPERRLPEILLTSSSLSDWTDKLRAEELVLLRPLRLLRRSPIERKTIRIMVVKNTTEKACFVMA
jgi:hypothetical protein